MGNTDFFSIDPAMLKTEERIIFAAMKVFALYSLDHATMRMIAKEADVNLSLVSYHFKSKDNLYQEVLKRVFAHITQNIRSYFDLTETDSVPPETAKRMLCEVIGYLAERMYSPQSSLFARIILQEHFSPSSFYEEIYDKFLKKILDLTARLVGILTGDKDHRKTSLQAFSIIGQLIGFRLERELIKRHLGLTGFSEEEMEELKSLVTRNILLQLEIKP